MHPLRTQSTRSHTEESAKERINLLDAADTRQLHSSNVGTKPALLLSFFSMPEGSNFQLAASQVQYFEVSHLQIVKLISNKNTQECEQNAE